VRDGADGARSPGSSDRASWSTLVRQRECRCGQRGSKTAIVAITIEMNHVKIISARLGCVPDLSRSSLSGFLLDVV
jgi:hypothetical protein